MLKPKDKGKSYVAWKARFNCPSVTPCLSHCLKPVTALAAHFSKLYAYVGAVASRVYKAAASDPDTLTFDQAMADTERIEQWKAAAAKEIQGLVDNGTWIKEDIALATSKSLPGTWVFCLKRFPDGSINKFKARYCV